MNDKAAELGCKSGDTNCLCNTVNYKYGIRDCTTQACPSDNAEQVLQLALSSCPSAHPSPKIAGMVLTINIQVTLPLALVPIPLLAPAAVQLARPLPVVLAPVLGLPQVPLHLARATPLLVRMPTAVEREAVTALAQEL